MLRAWLYTSLLCQAFPLAYYAADGGGGSGGSDTDVEEDASDNADDADDDADADANDTSSSNDTATDKQNDARSLDQRVATGVQNLIDRYGGNTRAALTQLYRERFADRESRRALRRENDDLRSSLPGKGRTVVTQQEAGLLREYKQLAPTPQKLKEQLAKISDLETKIAARERDDLLTSAANAAGYNAAVLKDVGGSLAYKVENETVDGKSVTTAYVVSADGKTKTKLTEYAANHWQHHLPSLITTANNGARGQGAVHGSGNARVQGGVRKLAAQAGAAGANARGTGSSDRQQGVADRIIGRYSAPGKKQE